jgi:hypothetical protein
MITSKIKSLFDTISSSVFNIGNENLSGLCSEAGNLLEYLSEENGELKKEIQKLRDEINKLKGEQGKPDIKPNKSTPSDHSSEKYRKRVTPKSERKKKSNKKDSVKINREVVCSNNLSSLPDDVVFKGFETRVLQDLKITPDNVLFKLQVHYSPSLNKSFIAGLPDGYQGDFGPSVKALIISLNRDSQMTQSNIHTFLTTHGMSIASSTISRVLTENIGGFHEEKEDIIKAGLTGSPYIHIDDTGCRVNGINQYSHILCSPVFTAFFTRDKKDRLTLLNIICQGDLRFSLNQESRDMMNMLGLPEKRIQEIKLLGIKEAITRNQIDQILVDFYSDPEKHKTNRRIILEASAITYYHNSEYFIDFLVADDAPQFNLLGKHKMLCWIHEGRHLKKLNPLLNIHKKELKNFLGRFWDYYGLLLDYKNNPTEDLHKKLYEDFDKLFSETTGYTALDDRIALTKAKRDNLLLVLDNPELPLHNNPAELGARVQARIRDISLHTISQAGTDAKDTFATIVQTAKKLKVNVYDYIYDRITKKYQIPNLADMIYEKLKYNST